jgi:hypothetical protein
MALLTAIILYRDDTLRTVNNNRLRGNYIQDTSLRVFKSQVHKIMWKYIRFYFADIPLRNALLHGLLQVRVFLEYRNIFITRSETQN